MKTNELREKSVDELAQLLDEKQLDAFRLRMAKAMKSKTIVVRLLRF